MSKWLLLLTKVTNSICTLSKDIENFVLSHSKTKSRTAETWNEQKVQLCNLHGSSVTDTLKESCHIKYCPQYFCLMMYLLQAAAEPFQVL